jgi:phage terminase large subunit-like protein
LTPDPLPETETKPEDRPDPVRWIEENFYLYDTARLITLHERQKWPLQLALSRDRYNRLRFSLVVWSWPKKSAKSSIIAAVALYVLCNKRRASVKLVANDLKQADSRVGYYLREAIKLHPVLHEQFKITPSGYRIENLANGAVCEMLPIDPAGEAGGNDDLIVLSELWAWKSAAQQKMYTEMALSPNKFFESQIWVDTYAGAEGESPVLEQMYDTGVKQGITARPGWEVYVNPDARQLTVWVTQHYLPWQVDDAGRAYLKAEEKRLVPAEFERLHGNRWVTGRNKFLPNVWWDACKVTPLPPLDKYMEVVVGIDAAVSGDCFAIVAVSREGRRVIVRYFKRWIRLGTGSFSTKTRRTSTTWTTRKAFCAGWQTTTT